jgi:hypothetical protein
MKPLRFPSLLLWVLVIQGFSWVLPASRADNNRIQTIPLHKGWNAVFLEVNPTNSDPATLFAHTPVSVAATYLASDRPVQFIRNPDSMQWNKDGWGVWYAADRPDAFLSSLHAVYGHQAYLILAQQDFTWTVSGPMYFEPLRWKSDSFNLVGFSVDETAPPTFDQFFGGSTAHRPYRIFRLTGDAWTLVSDPIRSTMRSGEAFWVYCSGRSEFQGPLNTRLAAGERVEFGDGTDSWIRLRNDSKDPMLVQVETAGSGEPLPLSYSLVAISSNAMTDVSIPLPAVYRLPVLEPGDTYPLWLGLNRQKMTANTQEQLLKISTDGGTRAWIPIIGYRPADSAATP